MADDEPSSVKSSFSFGFNKKKETKKLKTSIASDGVIDKEDEPDFVYSLEGKEVNSSKPKDEGPKKLVIPLIKENNWRSPFINGKKNDKKNEEAQEHEITDDLNVQAAKEILESTALQNQTWEDRGKPDPNLTVPLLVRNKVPDGFETDDKLDVTLRPDGPEDADYEQIPIDQFGFAMLRGMGWKDGEGIGKNKKAIAPLEATLRPKGLGLGADRSSSHQKKNGTVSNTGSREDEEALVMKTGAFCLIIKGSNKDMYGVVEGMDEDNARVMVKLTLSGKTVTFSQYSVEVVSKKDYDKFSKYLNKGKVDKYKKEQDKKLEQRTESKSDRSSHERDRQKESYESDQSSSRHAKSKKHKHTRSPERKEYSHRKSHKDSDKNRKRKHKHDHYSSDEYVSSSGDREPKDKKTKKERKSEENKFSDNHVGFLWVRPDIRVRIIDKKFKHGKYYKSKVVIVDVVSADNCVCRTEEGKVLDGLSQRVLETVIPKEDHAHALIVSGKYRGQIGEVVKRSKEKCEALLQLLSDRDTVLKLGYDDICEYVGNIDDDLNY